VLTDTIRLLVDRTFYSLLHAKDRVLVMARKRVERMPEYIVIMKEFSFNAIHSLAKNTCSSSGCCWCLQMDVGRIGNGLY